MSLGKTELVIHENFVITEQFQSRLLSLLQQALDLLAGTEATTETTTGTTETTTTVCEDNC
jgi:hypothetical protein